MKPSKPVFAFFVLILQFATVNVFLQRPTDDLIVLNETSSRLRGVIEKFTQDVGAFKRLYTAQTSANRAERFRQLYAEYSASLAGISFDSLNNDEQVDYVLFANHLRRETRELDRERVQFEEMAALLPFARTISDLEDQRRRLESIDPGKTAALLDVLARQIGETQKTLEDGKAAKPKRTVANRAVRTIVGLRSTLRGWYNFHNLYDPSFSWWNKKPYEAVEDALQKYSTFVVSKLVGISPDDKTTIIGDPDRQGSFDRRTAVRDDPVHTGRACADREQGVRLVCCRI